MRSARIAIRAGPIMLKPFVCVRSTVDGGVSTTARTGKTDSFCITKREVVQPASRRLAVQSRSTINLQRNVMSIRPSLMRIALAVAKVAASKEVVEHRCTDTDVNRAEVRIHDAPSIDRISEAFAIRDLRTRATVCPAGS